MKERVLAKSSRPKPNQRLEAALGRFIIAWAILEQEMDLAIMEICRLDDDLAMSITSNLGTKAKLDMFRSLAHSLREVWETASLANIDRLAADTGDASGTLRNFIVHGQPFQIKFPDDDIEIWAKFAARKGGVQGRAVRLDTEYVNERTERVMALVGRWEEMRAQVFEDVGYLELSERA